MPASLLWAGDCRRQQCSNGLGAPVAFRPHRRFSSTRLGLGLAALITMAQAPAAFAQTARMLDASYAEAWLATVREDGRQHGFLATSERVFRTSSGRYYVPDEKDRAAILALRFDRSAAMALQQAFEHRLEIMFAERIGRAPTRRDRTVLAALGPTDGARLIRLAETAPDQSAASHLPESARLHRRYFFDGYRERSAREALAIIEREVAPTVSLPPERRAVAPAPQPAKRAVALRRGLRDTVADGELAAAQ